MDLQIFLALSAASLAAVFIAQIFVSGTFRFPGMAARIAQYVLVIAVTIAGAWLVPGIYGYVSATVLVLMLAPMWAAQLALQAARNGQNAKAARWMRLAALLHPTRQFRFAASLHRISAEPTCARQLAALDTIGQNADPFEKVILELQKLRLTGDWAGLVACLETAPPQIANLQLEHAIRGLGETGQLDRMVAVYRQMSDLTGGAALQLAMLMVLAFCGRVEATASHLAAGAGTLPHSMQLFWMATALQAAGRAEEASRVLQSVQPDTLTELQRESFRQRLARPVAHAGHLAPASSQLLSHLEAKVRDSGTKRRQLWRQAPLTLLLIALNVGFYLVEIYVGDPESGRTLFMLGALWPDAVTQDQEWWRLLSAMFLHAGPEHIFSNMLALWVLGSFVERAFGWWRMLVIYMAGGLLSMAGVLWMMQAGLIEPNLIVGASGAIFALLGAIGFTRLSDYLHSRALSDRRNLTMIGVILFIQVVIDLAVPQISFSAHGLGLAAGVGLSLLLAPRRGYPR